MDIQHIAAPEAGKDYPCNWNEFLDWFGSEASCLAYLERLRWPQGFVCPSCGVTGDPYRSSRARLMCRSCSHQSTVTAGTIFDKTRTPLRVWLAGAWYLTNQKHGLSALGPQRVLGRLSDFTFPSKRPTSCHPGLLDGMLTDPVLGEPNRRAVAPRGVAAPAVVEHLDVPRKDRAARRLASGRRCHAPTRSSRC
jgi:hypothetical protein